MGYRENIMAKVRTDTRHPVHLGVRMQAHHLVSKKGVKMSFLKSDLEHLGYDINVSENLVLLPCTLKGACHLKVQLHRGNHTAPVEADLHGIVAADDDDASMSYHMVVTGMLATVKLDIERGKDCQPGHDLQKDINRLSATLLKGIQTFAIPLTSISKSFFPGVGSGCCGVDSTPEAKAKLDGIAKGGTRPTCPKGRDHLGQEGIRWAGLAGLPWTLEIGK
jgi:A nuclease family of the HNH/ENDO VII superfamily with conserved AHH